jgi:hypothetical protein
MNNIDILGKLLAMENITIVRANEKTASFDTKNRVLTIPLWTNMTPELESMLVSHEVAHALFTENKTWVDAIELMIAPKSYYNIVEDARIERLMKVKYAGIKKTFFLGYKELYERDIFNTKDCDIESMKLIDRINLFFKFGLYYPDLMFSNDEMIFVNRAESVNTMAEMIQLAEDIYLFTKSNEQDDSDVEQYDPDDGLYSDSEDSQEVPLDNPSSDTTSFKNDKREVSNEESDGNEFDENDEAVTDKALNENLSSSVDMMTKYITFNLDDTIRDNVVYSYKKILDFARENEIFMNKPRVIRDDFIPKFKNDNKRVTSYLAKEFEMKKSARGYTRAKIAKSGSLDTNRMFSYKTSNDIFRRVTTIPNEKNHGMVFLLDWSASMDSCIADTIHQTIHLVSFCRRVNIPFEVFAFASNVEKGLNINYEPKYSSIYSNQCFTLLNLFSSKMVNHEFNEMIDLMINDTNSWSYMGKLWRSGNIFPLHSTPLNDALIFMMKYIPKFQQSTGVEKTSLVVLSDGASNPLHYELPENFRSTSGRYVTTIFDPVTKKEYKHNIKESRKVTLYLYDILKNRLPNLKIIGFHLLKSKHRSILESIEDNFGREPKLDEAYEIKILMDRNGVFSYDKPDARDVLFFVKLNRSTSDSDDFEVSDTDRASSIAKKFTKNVNKMKTSKILLDKFISTVG